MALVLCLALPGALAPLTSAGAQQAPQPLYMLLTDDDILLADMTLQRALETALSDDTLTWRNAVSGNYGSVTPRRTYKTKGGFFCRVYAETVTVGGRSELYRDTACRDINGIWKPIR